MKRLLFVVFVTALGSACTKTSMISPSDSVVTVPTAIRVEAAQPAPDLTPITVTDPEDWTSCTKRDDEIQARVDAGEGRKHGYVVTIDDIFTLTNGRKVKLSDTGTPPYYVSTYDGLRYTIADIPGQWCSRDGSW